MIIEAWDTREYRDVRDLGAANYSLAKSTSYGWN